MCCGVFGNEQALREYLLAIHEGELRCTDCDHYCSDIEKNALIVVVACNCQYLIF